MVSLGATLDGEQQRLLGEELDVNKNGRVTLEEFLCSVKARAEGVAADQTAVWRAVLAVADSRQAQEIDSLFAEACAFDRH